MKNRRFQIASALEDWFVVVKRPMPWRKKPTPYCCWLSEIMMRKTTYAAVLLKGLWELPTLEEAADVTQVFSHFKLEQRNFKVVRTDAEFRDPKSVPLTTATRKALQIMI